MSDQNRSHISGPAGLAQARPEQNGAERHLFVYGTLLTAVVHPMGELLREHGRLIGPGSFHGRLYVIDDPDDRGANSYPGAIALHAGPSGHTQAPTAHERVHGEIYRLERPDLVLPTLDRYEACGPDFPAPHEFTRASVAVDCIDGLSCIATTYLYNFAWNLETAIRLHTGRYQGEVWGGTQLNAAAIR